MKKLDPRTKIIILISLSMAALFTENIVLLLSIAAVTILLMLLLGVSLKSQGKKLVAAMGMLIFVFLIQAIFGNWHYGIIIAVRLMIIIMSAEIIMTGQPRDYLLALIQWKMPYELAYMVILAFHFFPILREEALDIYYSIQLRGTELKKTSLRKKFKAYKNMCMPIMSGALSRARDTSIAMEARGFRVNKTRTYMRRLKLRKRDVAIMLIMPIIAGSFIWAGKQLDDRGLYSSDGYSLESLEKEVVVSMTDGGGVTISWSSNDDYEGYALIDGEKYEASRVSVCSGQYYRYEAVTDELECGKVYEYNVGSNEERSKTASFKVNNDRENENFSFLVMGDVQYKNKEEDFKSWGRFLEDAYCDNPESEFMLMLGDMVDKGADPGEWKLLLSNGESVFCRLPLMTTIGNHESPGSPNRYKEVMAMPSDEQFYSFDYGNCHFISLNSCILMEENLSKEGYSMSIDEVDRWLKNDLRNSDARWKIAYMHHPMYPVADDDEIYERMREHWEDIFVKNGVNLVLCGHQHCYMRTEEIEGITYVMLRSGKKETKYYRDGQSLPDYVEAIDIDNENYMLIEVKKNELRLIVRDAEGRIIDSLKKKKGALP